MLRTSEPHLSRLARRVLVASLVVLAVFGLAYLVLRAGTVVLLAFGGVLLAVLLDGLAGWTTRHTGIKRGFALALVGTVLVGTLVGLVWALGPRVAAEFGELGGTLTGGATRIREFLSTQWWAQPILSELTAAQADGTRYAARALGAFSTLLGGFANLVVILFLGVYLAVDPGLYRRGLLHLVDKRHRARAGEVLVKAGVALRGWLKGQFIAMAIVGVLTTVGLLILGVPLALALGLIAFAFSFVPYIGPIASFVPAILVAFIQSPQLALYTAGLYLVVQSVESYLVTPLVQQRIVSLPPGVLIFFQVLLGALAGVVGVALATPLAVVTLVLVQMLYVEDVLDDHTVEVLGEGEASEPDA